jgi:tetratricopeptide (TPR) repeat protein
VQKPSTSFPLQLMLNRSLQILAVGSAILMAVDPLHAKEKKEEATPAPVAQTGGTADELFAQAKKFFDEKNYKAALDAYLQFQIDYGTAPEAAVASFNALYPIAICQVQLSNFTGALEAIKAALEKQPPNNQTKLSDAQRQDLTFWLGIAELQEKNYAGAREAMEKFIAFFPPDSEKNRHFVRQNPAAGRIPEARTSIGTSYILEGKYQEAADYYAKLKGSLSPDTRGRAVIFQLYALEQLGDFDGAMKVVTEEYPNMGNIAQLISFQTLTLRIGTKWLEEGQFRKAIQCLQRVWTFDRLIKHQENRLADLRSKLKAAEANAGDPYTRIVYSRLVNDVTRELENFRKFQGFDILVRFRLANAYVLMKRYRESALIMQNMVAELPSNLTLEPALNVIKCWDAQQDWPNTFAASQDYVQRFPSATNLPEVLLIKAKAQQRLMKNEEAAAAFLQLTEKFPDSTQAPEARYSMAHALLSAEKYMDSVKAFDGFLEHYPKHPLADDAAYYRAICFKEDRQYEQCRVLMDEYVTNHPKGINRSQAFYYKAYCLQQMGKYPAAIDELLSYLEEFPGEPNNNEARQLLADALMNEGFMDDGIAELKKIPPEDTDRYEQGIFRKGQALKEMEEYNEYRDLMQNFLDKYPRSPRVGEAIANLGWYWNQLDQPDKARELYWKAIQDLGNEPLIKSVEDLFTALARLYRAPEEQIQYLTLLRDKTTEAAQKNEKTRQTRLLWAQAQALKKSDPTQSKHLLIQAAATVDVRDASPAVLVDIANALIESGRDADGEKMLRDALRWNPRALQKDRILASLGDMELKKGNEAAALALYKRFERENLGSTIYGPTMLSLANLQSKRGDKEAARKTLDALLRAENIRSDIKAQALFTTGEIYLAENKPQLAIPYFIQVYNMYGRWKPWVAKSYFQAAAAFEKIKETDKARRTLQEMLEKTELEETPEFPLAKDRLQALGGPLPKSEPTPDPASPSQPPTSPAQG